MGKSRSLFINLKRARDQAAEAAPVPDSALVHRQKRARHQPVRPAAVSDSAPLAVGSSSAVAVTGESSTRRDGNVLMSSATASRPSSSKHSAVPSSSSSTPADGREDIWNVAERELCKDERKKKIWIAYQEILTVELGPRPIEREAAEFQSRLRQLLDTKTHELEMRKGPAHASKLKILLLGKQIVSSLSGVSPLAAVAGAGACLILTLLVQAAEQHVKLLEGLRAATAATCRVNVIDGVYRSERRAATLASHSADFEEEFESSLTSLCALILEFQARALCYMRKHRITQMTSDMFQTNGWDKLKYEISDSETSLLKNTLMIDATVLHTALVPQTSWIQGFESDINNLLSHWERPKAKTDDFAERKHRRAEFFRQLYQTCPYAERKNRNKVRVEGTCEWFTSHSRFLEWSDRGHLLWVSADPGCGKSVLARYLVDRVLPKANRTVCYFFFKDDFQDQRSAATAICALLRQLLLENPYLLQDSVLEKIDNDGERFYHSFDDLWATFIAVVSDESAGEVLCVLDALDECQETDRYRLIQAMQDLKPTCDVKFLLTSRPYAHLQREFRELQLKAPLIHLNGEGETEVEQIAKEITLVISSRVESISRKRLLEQNESDFLKKQLAAIPNRTYLWVELTMNVIENTPAFTRGNVRRAITKLPKTVDDAYEKILERSSDPTKARKLLYVVLGAAYPLSLQQLSTALAVDEHHRSVADVSEEEEPQERFRVTVRDLCGLFIVFIGGKIYFLHQTAREFLIAPNNAPDTTQPHHKFSSRGQSAWKNSLHPVQSQRVLAEASIRFLLLERNYDPLSYGQGDPDFRKYAESYWIEHFHAIKSQSSADLNRAAPGLCDPDRKKLDSRWLVYAYPKGKDSHGRVFREWFDHGRSNCSHLHITSYFGLEALSKMLLHDGADIEATDSQNRTPLYYAAYKGRADVVRLLLTYRAKTETRSRYRKRTPLLIGAERGHHAVVQALLESGADVEAEDDTGQTALQLAVKEITSFGICKILVENNASISGRGSRGRTPLHWAVWHGNYMLVEFLLRNGADNTTVDDDGKTPMQIATEQCSGDLLKLLMQDTPIDHVGLNGRTLLSHAAEAGSWDIASFLLKRRANLESHNGNGWTPLCFACHTGRQDLIADFLKRGAYLQVRTLDGFTPLAIAASFGWPGPVQMLLAAGADIEAEDKDGRTPLELAVHGYKEMAVRILLEHGASTALKSMEGRVSLADAVAKQYDGMLYVYLMNGAEVYIHDEESLVAMAERLLESLKTSKGHAWKLAMQTNGLTGSNRS